MRGTSHLGIGAALGAALFLLALVPAAQAAPGNPGVPGPPSVIFEEDFENVPNPAVAQGLASYQGEPPTSMTYTANSAWLNGAACNGVIGSWNSTPGTTGCPSNIYNAYVRPIARAIGNVLGGGDDNQAMADVTIGGFPAPATPAATLQTLASVPLTSSSRFITFSIDAGAICPGAHPLLRFFLLDGANPVEVTDTAIDPCTDPRGAMSGSVRVGSYATDDSILFSGGSLGVRLTNDQTSGSGNDYAVDNLRILDATPQLDKEFESPTLRGQPTTLTFTITNTSDLAAKRGWSFTDNLPAGLTIADQPNVTSNCANSAVGFQPNDTSVDVSGDLNAGQQSCTVTVDVVSPTPGTFQNCPANITALVGLDAPGCSTLIVEPASDLSITKQDDSGDGVADVGENLTYRLEVTNNGPDGSGPATITDTLPANVTYVSDTAGCDTTQLPVLSCQLGGMDVVGNTNFFEVTVSVDPAAASSALANHAEVDGPNHDPDLTDNEADNVVLVPPLADLSLAKSVSPANAAPGDTVTYELTVTNDGPSAADDVVLDDLIPDGVTFLDSTPGPPDCELAAGSLSCELGTIPAGETRTVIVRATVDPAAPPPDHRHLIPVEKVEQQIDLEPGETETITLSCPQAGQVMADGSVRADAVDQGTGTLADIETRTAQSASPGSYEFTVTNNAAGRAQAKVFGVCIPGQSAVEQGHAHDLIVSDPPLTLTAPLTAGRHELRLSCGPGRTAIAPGIDVSGGAARLVGSEPEPDGGRLFIVEVAEPTVVTLTARCLDNELDTADGHTHELELEEVRRTVTVPANSTVNEVVACADDAKGIVASYDLAPGLILAGNDPQPKSRVFKLVNPTGAPLEATIDLLCLGDRTVIPGQIENSASVSSPTPDLDLDDRAASATFQLALGPPPPPAPAPGPIAPPFAPPVEPGSSLGMPSLADAPAVLDLEGPAAVGVPVACGVADCSGSLLLRAVKSRGKIDAGDRLGGAEFAIDPGSAIVDVPVSEVAARLAARGKLRRVRVALGYDAGAGVERSVRVFKLAR